MEKKKLSDNEIIAEWRGMLKMFESILALDQDESAKSQYHELIKMAAASDIMTPRQKTGITDRCYYRISLIDSKDKKPFANTERQIYKLLKEQSNGKP